MGGILVFGATGFLGRHLLEHLSTEENVDELTCVARSDPRTQGVAAARATWVELDVAQATPRQLTDLLESVKPDAVVNCAGCIRGSSVDLAELNVEFVRHLVAAIASHGSSSFVHLGSAAEYGVQPLRGAIAEDAPTNPVAEYGRSKLAGTRIVSGAIERGVISGRVLRIFNPIGSGSPESSVAGAAARTIDQAIAQDAHELDFGYLGDFRDFIDARDVARAIALAAASETYGSAILNVGSGHATQVRDLVERLIVIAGYTGDAHEAIVSDVPPLVPWQRADISRIRAELAWSPEYSLNDSLTALWASYGLRASLSA